MERPASAGDFPHESQRRSYRRARDFRSRRRAGGRAADAAAPVRRRHPHRRGLRHRDQRAGAPRARPARETISRSTTTASGRRSRCSPTTSSRSRSIMLLDRSGSMKPNFDLEEQAAEAFVRAMLPGDKARIGSFAKHIQIDPDDFTSDRDKLLKILRTELQNDGPTPLWNAVDRGIDKLLLEQGRRVVLVFTDGVDMPLNFSNHNKSLKDVMKRAEENDVMVYAIGLAGQNGMPDSAAARRTDRGRGGMAPARSAASAAAGSAATAAAAAAGEARRGAAEDRGGDRRRLLRADVAAGSGVDLRARRQRAASPVRARLHAGEARRQDARPHGPSVAAGAHRACPQTLSRVERQVTRSDDSHVPQSAGRRSASTARPSLEQYKKHANDLAAACRSSEPGRHRRVGRTVARAIPRSKHSRAQTLTSRDCALTAAQFVIARAHGFESWPIVRGASRRIWQEKESPVSMFEAAAEADRRRRHRGTGAAPS